MNYYVVRTHSHTDKQKLWKVMSRPFKDKLLADDWKDSFEEIHKKTNPRSKHKFFVVSTEGNHE